MISNCKREINSTIYPVPKNDSANSKAKEEHVQYGCLKRTCNFLRIGEKIHETFRLFTPLLKNSEWAKKESQTQI